MSETEKEKKKRAWVSRHWGKATLLTSILVALVVIPGDYDTSWITENWGKAAAIAAAFVAFLGGYDTIRNQGQSFICDLAGLIGQRDTLPLCRDTGQADDSELLAHLEYLKGREAQLSPARREQLRRLETAFEERAFSALSKAVSISGEPVDAQAMTDTRVAVRETVEEGDAEQRRALAMIAEGDHGGGLQRLEELASAQASKNVAQWRRIGRLAYGVDTMRAMDAYQKVIALDHSDPWDAIYLGRLYARAGKLAQAGRTFEEALARLPETGERDRSVLLNEIGNVLTAQGDLAGALQSYRDAMSIRKRLAETDPRNTQWQRDLSVSHNKIGDMLTAQGDLAGALQSYRDAMSIAKRLAEADPRNTEWQRDLSVSHIKIGDALKAQGDLAGALQSYRDAMSIAKRLAEADPRNTQWQRDLSVSHNKIGDMLTAQGDLAGALQSYRDAMSIAKRLAEADPRNTEWQRDLSVSHNKIGNVLKAQGDLAGALQSYRDAMTIRKRLAETDPRNAEWQRDLAVSQWRLAGYPDSGVTWQDVAATFDAMQARGILLPGDKPFAEQARHRAASD